MKTIIPDKWQNWKNRLNEAHVLATALSTAGGDDKVKVEVLADTVSDLLDDINATSAELDRPSYDWQPTPTVGGGEEGVQFLDTLKFSPEDLSAVVRKKLHQIGKELDEHLRKSRAQAEKDYEDFLRNLPDDEKWKDDSAAHHDAELARGDQ